MEFSRALGTIEIVAEKIVTARDAFMSVAFSARMVKPHQETDLSKNATTLERMRSVVVVNFVGVVVVGVVVVDVVGG